MPCAGWLFDGITTGKRLVAGDATVAAIASVTLVGATLAKENASKLNASDYVILIHPMGKIPIVERYPKT